MCGIIMQNCVAGRGACVIWKKALVSALGKLDEFYEINEVG